MTLSRPNPIGLTLQLDRTLVIGRIRESAIRAWNDSRFNTSLNRLVEHICEETAEALIDEINRTLAEIPESTSKPGIGRKKETTDAR